MSDQNETIGVMRDFYDYLMNARPAEIRHKVFARHSNPWSAWSRWATTPLVLVPVWTRRWSQFAPVAAWMVANALVFPKPANESAWATRAVLGEERWIVERPKDTALAVNGVGSVLLAAALVAAHKRRLVPALACTAGSMAAIMVYWKLMVDYYDTHRL